MNDDDDEESEAGLRTQGDFLVRGGFRLCSSSFLLRGKYCNIISRALN